MAERKRDALLSWIPRKNVKVIEVISQQNSPFGKEGECRIGENEREGKTEKERIKREKRE